MNELTDRIISSHLKQRPAAHRAYQQDQYFHAQIETARGLLGAVESAMQREGIPHDSAERVLSNVMQASLGDWERDKLDRERLLLLADMSPSAADVTISPVFTEPGDDFSVRDELKPYAGPGSEETTP